LKYTRETDIIIYVKNDFINCDSFYRRAKMEDQNVGTQVDPNDAEKNKWMGVLAYFIFFIPLLVAKDSAFGKFHANQGLNLLLLEIAVSIVGGIVPVIGWFIILPVGYILCFVFAIMGIINAYKGITKELPLIGKINIIK
jgi:uncharacterized membrane protein